MSTEADAPATGEIEVFFHILAINGSEYIVDSLFSSLISSNLYDYSSNINLIILGDKNLISKHWLSLPKVKINFFSPDTQYCEFPAIQSVYNLSLEKDKQICYFHTKGVTKDNVYTTDWRNYLSYFNIDQWRERSDDLKRFDTSGVNLLGAKRNKHMPVSTWAIHPSTAPLHYSGNFWWANASYVRTLPDPMREFTPSQDWLSLRHMCEMWLCYSDTGRHSCAWQSDIDHYSFLYPKDIYEKE